MQTVGEDPAIDQVLVFYDQPPGLDGAVEESWGAVRDGIDRRRARVSPADDDRLLDAARAARRRGRVALRPGGHPGGRRPAHRSALRRGARAAAPAIPSGCARSPGRAGRVVRGRARGDGEWLAEHDAKELLRGAGVDVVDGPPRRATRTTPSLALAELGGHIALKLSAAAIQHKSELGAVELGLRSRGRRSRARVRAARPRSRGDTARSVLAERMAAPGVELIVAARADAIVPALVIGLGGVWTELLDDVAIVPLPADAARIERALRSLRGAPLLTGGRGTAPRRRRRGGAAGASGSASSCSRSRSS